jgi:hypothetical protein
VWQEATNLITNGGFETNLAGWSSKAAGFERDSTTAKFGRSSAKITNTTDNFGATRIAAPVANATKYTFSIWVNRTETAADVEIVIRNPADSAYYGRADVPKVAGWQRVAVSYTSAADEVPLFGIQKKGDAAPSIYHVDAVQLEANQIPTPYIETNGAPAARKQATLQLPSSGVLNETLGWFATRMRMGWASTLAPLGQNYHWFMDWSDEPIDDSIHLTYFHPQQVWHMDRKVAKANDQWLDVADTFAVGDHKTLVFAWTATRLKLSVDGRVFATAPNTYLPDISAPLFDLGYLSSSLAANFWADSSFEWVACGIGELSDTDAANLAALPSLLSSPLAMVRDRVSPTGRPTFAGNCVRAIFEKAPAP